MPRRQGRMMEFLTWGSKISDFLSSKAQKAGDQKVDESPPQAKNLFATPVGTVVHYKIAYKILYTSQH
jgi:hypothetical protein